MAAITINDFGDEMHAYVGDVLLATARRQHQSNDHRRWHWAVTGGNRQPSVLETKDRARHILRQFARDVLIQRAIAASKP